MMEAQADLDQETVIFANKSGVPHEESSGNRQYSMAHLLAGQQVEGVICDKDDVLRGMFDCPGFVVQGKNADGSPRIVGELGPGSLRHKEPSREPFIPAINHPCPTGCGGTLVYLNPKLTRCDSCGAKFQDTKAQ
jgi:hypothetical protein